MSSLQLLNQPLKPSSPTQYFTSTDIAEASSIPKQEEPEATTSSSDSDTDTAAQNGHQTKPILPHSASESIPNHYLASESRLDYNSDQHSKGFFKIPRSLRDHPQYESAHVIHRHILHTIIEHCSWKPRKFDDHLVVLDIAPGELCISLRELADLCGPGCNKNWVVGAIKWFTRPYFGLTSILRQEVRHIRQVITVTHKDTYDQIIYGGQTGGPIALRQPSDTKENPKQLNHEYSPVQSVKFELTDQQLKVVQRLSEEHHIDVEAAAFAASEYSEAEIVGVLKQRKRTKSRVHHETHWLLATLKKKREKLIEFNKKLRPRKQSLN